jgi:hypothetical protein
MQHPFDSGKDVIMYNTCLTGLLPDQFRWFIDDSIFFGDRFHGRL